MELIFYILTTHFTNSMFPGFVCIPPPFNVCYCVSIFEYSRHCILNMTRVFSGWPDDRGCDRCALIGQLLQEGPPGGVQENISLFWPSAFVPVDLQMTGFKFGIVNIFQFCMCRISRKYFKSINVINIMNFILLYVALIITRQRSNFNSLIIRIKHLSYEHTECQASSGSFEVLTLAMTLGNGSGTD